MKHTYRWGILGAGKIAEKFCTALNFVERADVYAVASKNIENAAAYAAKFGAVNVYDNYLDLVMDKDVDIIYIATPHAFHFEHAMLCLKNNKPVLCEKPLTLSFKQSAEMIALATKNKLFLMEGLWTACMPFMDKIKNLIKEDILGEPRHVHASFGFFAPPDKDSRLFNKALGGGSVMDVGIYPISLATIIFGEPTDIKTIAKLTDTGVDESTNMLFKYANGQTAQLLSSIGFNTFIEAEIIGSKGKIKIDQPWFKATDFTLYLNNGDTEHFSMPHLSNGFEHEIEEVIYCLDNGLLQSEKVPHQLTLTISKIMESVLKEVGVVYSVAD